MPKKKRETISLKDVGILDAATMLGQSENTVTKETATMSNENTVDTPAIEASNVLKRGRKPGTKVTNIVKAADFIPKYRQFHAEGLGFEEMGTKFGLGKMTVIQKRLKYNKDSAEAGHPLNLPLPASTGTRGAKKIDWSKFTAKVEESVNS